MNQTLNNKFLETYKRLEIILKESGYTVKDYEDSITEKCSDMADRLRLCRTVRNFLSHNSVNFISASQEMISFIQDLLVSLDKDEMSVKKIMNKHLYTSSELIKDLSAEFSKRKEIFAVPIFDNKGTYIGAVTPSIVFDAISKGSYKNTSKINSLYLSGTMSVINVSSDSTYKEIKRMITPGIIVLVYDKNDKIVGWL